MHSRLRVGPALNCKGRQLVKVRLRFQLLCMSPSCSYLHEMLMLSAFFPLAHSDLSLPLELHHVLTRMLPVQMRLELVTGVCHRLSWHAAASLRCPASQAAQQRRATMRFPSR